MWQASGWWDLVETEMESRGWFRGGTEGIRGRYSFEPRNSSCILRGSVRFFALTWRPAISPQVFPDSNCNSDSLSATVVQRKAQAQNPLRRFTPCDLLQLQSSSRSWSNGGWSCRCCPYAETDCMAVQWRLSVEVNGPAPPSNESNPLCDLCAILKWRKMVVIVSHLLTQKDRTSVSVHWWGQSRRRGNSYITNGERREIHKTHRMGHYSQANSKRVWPKCRRKKTTLKVVDMRGERATQHGNVEVTGFCLSACDFPPIATLQISTPKQIHAQKSWRGHGPAIPEWSICRADGVSTLLSLLCTFIFLVENCLKMVEFVNLMFVAGSIAPSKSASYSWPISSTKARTIFLRIYGPVVPHHCFPTWSLRATVGF